MLSIFSLPKPFRGHVGTIQRNAIRSWTLLQPQCEILLCGDEAGTREVAAEFGVKHVPEIMRSDIGTPLLDSVFAAAHTAARYDILAFLNADIILMSDFLPSIQSIPRDSPFLAIGRRWDLEVDKVIDFTQPNWEGELRTRVAEYGSLHTHWGVDYFVFVKQLWPFIPPFLVGRMYYDQWLISRALKSGARVVDATERVFCIHQNHDRKYDSVGLEGPQGETRLRGGWESRRNLELAGGRFNLSTVRDSNWVLGLRGLRRAPWSLVRARYNLRSVIASLRFLADESKKPRESMVGLGKRVLYLCLPGRQHPGKSYEKHLLDRSRIYQEELQSGEFVLVQIDPIQTLDFLEEREGDIFSWERADRLRNRRSALVDFYNACNEGTLDVHDNPYLVWMRWYHPNGSWHGARTEKERVAICERHQELFHDIRKRGIETPLRILQEKHFHDVNIQCAADGGNRLQIAVVLGMPAVPNLIHRDLVDQATSQGLICASPQKSELAGD